MNLIWDNFRVTQCEAFGYSAVCLRVRVCVFWPWQFYDSLVCKTLYGLGWNLISTVTIEGYCLRQTTFVFLTSYCFHVSFYFTTTNFNKKYRPRVYGLSHTRVQLGARALADRHDDALYIFDNQSAVCPSHLCYANSFSHTAVPILSQLTHQRSSLHRHIDRRRNPSRNKPYSIRSLTTSTKRQTCYS